MIIKRSLWLFFFISLVAAIIVLSGCSAPECETDIQCDDNNACTNDKCNNEGDCAHQRIVDCTCGDRFCDEDIGENECSCPNDCGICGGSIDLYVENFCEEIDGIETCIQGIPPDKLEEKSLSDVIDTRKFKMLATYYYDEPFDVSRSTFDVDISLDSVQSGVKEPKIIRIQIFEKLDRRGRELNILGAKEVNKVLWSQATEIYEEIVLDNMPGNGTATPKTLTVRISYEYLTTVRGQDQITTGQHDKEITTEITLINPGTPPRCPGNCEDGNVCTLDFCEDAVGFCEHRTLSRPCCGNNVCDADENTCTCPQDCGSCNLLVGEFIEYACVRDECVTRLRDSEEVKPITLLDGGSWGDFTIETRVTFNKPFSLEDDVFELFFEYINRRYPDVSDIVLKKVQMLDDNELLGEITFNKEMRSIGVQHTIELPMNFAKNIPDEEKKNLKLKIFYDYQPPRRSAQEKPPMEINKIYTINYGDVIFVNPEV